MIRWKGCNLMVMMGWGLCKLCLSVIINPMCKVRNQIETETYHLLSEKASQGIFPNLCQGTEVRSTSCLLSFLSSFCLKKERLAASQHSLYGAKLGTSNSSPGDPLKSGSVSIHASQQLLHNPARGRGRGKMQMQEWSPCALFRPYDLEPRMCP